jgi:hypothetical protein
MRPARLSSVCLAVVLGAAGHLAAAQDTAEKKTCVNKREINAVTPLDDAHALVKASASRYYLFSLEKACQGFHVARKIALFDGTTRVCGDGSTLLSFEYPSLGPMRCRIEKIDSVADRAAAEELIASRAERR